MTTQLGHRHAATVLAMLISPIVGAAAVTGAAWLLLPELGLSDASVALAAFLMASVLALPATVVIGPFVYALMQLKRWRGWTHYLAAGAAGALIASAALMGYMAASGGANPPASVFVLAWALPIGMVTGVVGWAIRRPDRDGWRPRG